MLNSSSPDTPREFTGEESAETLVGRWCSALHHPLACRPAARRRRLCCTARAAGSLCPRPAPPRASAPPGGSYGRDMAQRLAARTHRVGLISASRISANRIGCASRLYHGCLTAVSRSLSRPNLVRISRAPPSPPPPARTPRTARPGSRRRLPKRRKSRRGVSRERLGKCLGAAVTKPSDLGWISAASRLHLGCISAASRLYLADELDQEAAVALPRAAALAAVDHADETRRVVPGGQRVPRGCEPQALAVSECGSHAARQLSRSCLGSVAAVSEVSQLSRR